LWAGFHFYHSQGYNEVLSGNAHKVGKMRYPGITNRLSFRIILPVIALMLVVGAVLFFSLDHVATDIAKGETASVSLIPEIRAAFTIAGVILLLASFLFIYYLEKTIQ
jgi:hypothetical protein